MEYVTFLLIISTLVALHELGHLLAARCLGLPVASFSLGVGKSIYSKTIRGVQYRVAAIPLGGYVKLSITDNNQFYSLPLYKQIIFFLAGPIANFLTTFVLIASAHWFISEQSWLQIAVISLKQSVDLVIYVVGLLFIVFSDISQLSGAIGAISVGGKVIASQPDSTVYFCALLSANLAVINIVPIPPFDGGKIIMSVLARIFYSFRRFELGFMLAGWLSVATVMVLTTSLDIYRMFVIA